MKGGVFSLIGEGKIYLNDSLISNSYSQQGGFLYGLNNFFSQSVMTNVTFLNIDGNIDLISISNTDLVFDKCTFSNNNNKLATILESKISIINSILLNHKGNLFYCYFSSTLKVIGSTFSSVKESIEDTMYFEESTLEIQNSLFKDVENKNNAGSIGTGIYSKFYIQNSTFINYKFNCFTLFKGEFLANYSKFQNDNYLFTDNSKVGDIGCIYLESCLKIQIVASNFSGGKNVLRGGSININVKTMDGVNDGFFVVNKNNFHNNDAKSIGGALNILNGKGIISSCVFNENTAFYGGAIYFTNDKSSCKHKIIIFLINF